MYKNFSLTDQERKQILEQHQGKGYKQPLKESTLENAVDEIGLTPDEIDALTSSLIDMGKTDFKFKVADIASGESSDDMSSEMMEGGEMSDKEFKLRSAIDKIINKAGVISTLGIVPAAMFAGGGAGVAAGVTALTMLLLKDAAWWKKGHEMHKEMGDARKGTENMGVGDYLMGNKGEVDENLGMLARIAAPMAASYVGSKMADTNEDFVDTLKSGYNAVKSGVNNAVGALDKGAKAVANTVADTLQSDEAIKKFNDRISAIANVIKYAKKVVDPKTQQPAWMIVNPQSKVNGMRLDVYFKTYNVTAGEVVAARMVNQQGGKPLTGLQRTNSASNSTYRSSAAHPSTFAKLFNEQSSFIDTKQPVNVATPKQQPLSELGGYIGDAPEKISGPFLKEIDPSVYEDVSYIESTKAIIMLMRLFRGDLISKNAYDEVYKPMNEINKILKGEYWDKQKDLPF